MPTLSAAANDPLIDPDSAPPEEPAPPPTPGPMTLGPNRMTFIIPSYGTRLNLGERETGDKTSDPGITAETESHQHFFTFGAEDDAITILRLGRPTESIPAIDASTNVGLETNVRRFVGGTIGGLAGTLEQQVGTTRSMLTTPVELATPTLAPVQIPNPVGPPTTLTPPDAAALGAPPLVVIPGAPLPDVPPVPGGITVPIPVSPTSGPVIPGAKFTEVKGGDLTLTKQAPGGPPAPLAPSTDLQYPSARARKVGSVNHEAINHWNGYAMVTQGAAYNESKNNFVIVSAAGEVRIAAQTAVTLGSPGDVIIGADDFEYISTLAENEGDLQASDGHGRVATYFSKELASGVTKVHKTLAKTTKVLPAMFFPLKKPGANRPAWEGPGNTGNAQRLLLMRKLMKTVKKIKKAFLGIVPGERERRQGMGQAGIFGANTAVLMSRKAALVHAGLRTIVSAGNQVMVTGMRATLNAVMNASVQAGTVKVAGLSKVAMTSTFGKAAVTGRKGVTVSAMNGAGVFQASDHVNVVSTDNKVFVHGRTGFFISTGGAPAVPPVPKPSAGDLVAIAKNPVAAYAAAQASHNYAYKVGFAIAGSDTTLDIGIATTPGNFSAGRVTVPQIELRKSYSAMKFQKLSEIKLQKSTVVLKSPDVTIEATKKVTVQGKDISVKAKGKVYIL